MKKKRPPIATPLAKSKIRKNSSRKSSAVKKLERLADEDVRKKNPNTPVEWQAGVYFVATSFEQFHRLYNLKFASDASN